MCLKIGFGQFWTNRCPKIGFGQKYFWIILDNRKIGFGQICASKYVFGSFGQTGVLIYVLDK